MIAVHAGAGLNQDYKKSAYQKVCQEACKEGIQCIRSGLAAIDVVTQALVVLEDDPLTNAGHGSNLCIDGTIECDASLMSGRSLRWAGVGAIPSMKNPISVARELLSLQEKQHPLGLIPPHLIVSEPAKKWAQSRGFPTADLSTEGAKSFYLKQKRKLDNAEARQRDADGGGVDEDDESKIQRLDTVGAVAVDESGNLAAGVSSGGIVLKFPGRVGQAAAYGAGCWAQDTVAVSTSGNGEYLMRTLFAKECAGNLLKSSAENCPQRLSRFFTENYTESPFLKDVSIHKSAGIIAIIHSRADKRNELVWAHNTKTMALAYSTIPGAAKFVLSKLPENNEMLIESVFI